MNNTLSALCFWLVFQCPAAAQTPGKDSLLIHQVDSLVSLLDSTDLWWDNRQNFCTALVAELQTCRSKLSENSPASIKALQAMGRASAFAGNRAEAETFLLQSKAALEIAGQKESGAYVRTLMWLGETVWDTTIGWLNYDMLSLPVTKTYYAEAVGVLEIIGQTNSPDYWTLLDNLVRICHRLFLKTERDFFAAKLFAYYEKAVLIDGVLERDGPYMLCMSYGYCPEARKIIQLTLDKMGENHPGYLLSLCFFAGTYDWEGRYEDAVEYYKKYEYLRQNPPVNYEGGKKLNGSSLLGWDYWKLARYEEAEKIFANLYKQSEHGPAREWGFTGIMLANIYNETGRYKEAETLLRRVLDSIPELPDAVNNLANMYIRQGRLREALPLHLKAAELYDRQDGGGKSGRFYALSLQNLSWLYNELGDQPTALRYFQEAETLIKNIEGIEHPGYGMVLRKGAKIFRDMGRTSEADSLCKVSKHILSKSLGKNHPAYLKTCMEYGKNAFQDERWASAAERFGEAAEVQSDLLRQSAKYLSERELLAFQRTLTGYSDLFFSLMQKTPAGEPNLMAPFAFDQALLLKGFALEGKLAVSGHVARAEKPVQEKYAAWVGLHRRLATQYAKPVSERQSVEELEVEANVLEKELTKSFAVFAEAQRKTACADVRSALKTGEIAIEFVHYRFANPSPTDSTMYAALVLRPGVDAPVFVPLFEEKSLDALLDRNAERNEFYVKRLYTLADRGAKPLEKPRKTLYELLWKPLEPHMQDVNTVYYSPAGLLHRLNLAAIPTSVDSVLADRYNLVELGSTRQLVSPATTRPAANDALLFGGIRYDADSTEMSQANAGKDSILIVSRNLSRSLRSELGFAYTDSTLRTLTWGDLPFTEQEVSRVEKILKSAGFQSETLRGYATTEEAFKTMCAGEKPSPRVLHVATHGFFFPDPKEAVRGERGSGEQEQPFILSDHPMIRSGLILAGGNHAWATGKPIHEGMEDGILTAYEISQMNLSNTELVVLSACETGLGDIQGNEGVYGLQRAFKIAGVKYLVMSLWQVPDKQTSLLMTAFYKKWLEEKIAIPDAFRAAQRELREAGLDPYQWAGFVLVE